MSRRKPEYWRTPTSGVKIVGRKVYVWNAGSKWGEPTAIKPQTIWNHPYCRKVRTAFEAIHGYPR